MSERVIVNVSTGQYVKGMERLEKAFRSLGERLRTWDDIHPEHWPTHKQRPYAFKAFALKEAADRGAETLLWADACIVPGARPLTDLWEKIERDGYWIANNGYTNYEWTADAAYPALFAGGVTGEDPLASFRAYVDAAASGDMEASRALNRLIPHCVATTFGISLNHEIGRAILAEYYRLASETDAFCGPWANENFTNSGTIKITADRFNTRMSPCGPPDVRGHRHDQTALSVIAWRLGCKLSNCPEWFSYRGGENETTALVADGAY